MVTADRCRAALFRADASAAMGLGHVMRCLALAEELLDRGAECHFALADPPPGVAERLRRHGIRVHPLPAAGDPEPLRRLARVLAPDLLVLDGYHFSPAYRAALRGVATLTLVLDDDVLEPPLHGDLVLNSLPNASPARYPGLAPERLLLGRGYVPLRREFRATPPADQVPLTRRSHLLLNLGGSDPRGLSGPLALALLAGLPAQVTVDLVAGGGNPAVAALQALARAHDPHLQLHLDTEAMAALMNRAGLALVAAGSTLWELAALGVPAITVAVADNQAPSLTPPFNRWFLALDARSDPQVTPRAAAVAIELWKDGTRRASMGQTLADLGVGKGSARVCDAIEAALAAGDTR